MTAAHAGRAAGRVRVQTSAPPPFNWSSIGVIAGLCSAAAGVIAGYATLNDRVAHIEAQIPPGSIQRLDERTVQMQAALVRLESRP